MKKIIVPTGLILCLTALVSVGDALDGDFMDSYMQGMRLGMEQRRLELDEQLARQRMEIMRQEVEAMKLQRQQYTDAVYQKGLGEGFDRGFKSGYDNGYKQAIQDFVDYVANYLKTEIRGIQTQTIYDLGEHVFLQTSVQELNAKKKQWQEILTKEGPSSFIPKVYIGLINERLKELQPTRKGK